MPANDADAMDSHSMPAPRATGSTDVHALVTLHPDSQRRPRTWQTPRLGSPNILLQEKGEGRWTGRVGFLVRLEGGSLEELVAQLHDRHGIEARLDQEPIVA